MPRSLRALLALVAALASPVSAQAPADRPAPPTVTADDNGFAIRSADGAYGLRLRGDAQADGRFFVDDEAGLGVDQFFVRRARLMLQATLGGRHDARVQANFGQGRVELQDAYVSTRLTPALNVQAGKFKVPLGLEWLRAPTDLTLVELGLPSALVPRRDVGLMLHGAPSRRIDYQAGVFNGALDGQNADGDAGDAFDVAARVFAHPLRGTRSPLAGLGLGIGATLGTERGTLAAPAVAAYRASGGLAIARLRATGVDSTSARADGRRLRVSPQAYLYTGPLSVLAEYVVSEQATRLGGTTADLRADAWQVQAGYVLTGEDATYGRLRPRRPLGVGAGAFEVGARVGMLRMDDDAFPTFANPATQASRATALAAGLSWYPSAQVKWMANVERTTLDAADAAPAGTALPTETVILTRIQVAF